MTAQIIDGKAFAATLRERVTQHISSLRQEHEITPGLAVVLVGEDPAVNGILVQLPLPEHLDAASIINAIDSTKNVDGFHIANAGLLATGQQAMVPCTPLGCLMMIDVGINRVEDSDGMLSFAFSS